MIRYIYYIACIFCIGVCTNIFAGSHVYGFKPFQRVTLNNKVAKKYNFEEIDNYAKNTPKVYSKSVSTLSQYLNKHVSTDIEKARVIYSWLAYHILYDDETYNSGEQANASPQQVLASSRAFCDGFSGLYKAIGEEMGLEVSIVSGHAKGYGYNSKRSKLEINHAWNAIKIDGLWRLFDATWGAGFGKKVDGEMKSISKFDDTWFNINPYFAIFNHYPSDQKWTLLNRNITQKEYQLLPDFGSEVSARIPDFQPLFDYYFKRPNVKIPTFLSVKTMVKLYQFPKSLYLYKNKSYTFKIYAPNTQKIGIIDADNNWTFFHQKDGFIDATYTPKKRGKLSINIKDADTSNNYSGLLEYVVR